jgi:hypothetical protein
MRQGGPHRMKYGVNAPTAMQYSARPGARAGVIHWPMTIDVIDLRDFYSQRLGIVARRLINRGIRARWPERAGQRVLGHRLSDALSRPVPRGLRALHRLHAGGAGRAEMADGAADAGDPGRRILAAAAGCRGRPHPAGSCAGNVRRSGRAAARGVAGAGAVGPDDGGHPEPARGVDAHRHTPFGHGRPYSRSQITQLLRQTWFTPTAWGEALFMPPVGAAGSCARRWRGSASARRCRCRSPAFISWRRPSRSIARSPRTANARG